MTSLLVLMHTSSLHSLTFPVNANQITFKALWHGGRRYESKSYYFFMKIKMNFPRQWEVSLIRGEANKLMTEGINGTVATWDWPWVLDSTAFTHLCSLSALSRHVTSSTLTIVYILLTFFSFRSISCAHFDKAALFSVEFLLTRGCPCG